MKILCIHSDSIEFEATKKALKDAEEISDKTERFEECLVVFATVEKDDERKPLDVAKNSVDEIIKVAGQVKTNNIVLYPFAHLSANLANPKTALDVLKHQEMLLKEQKFKVGRAPFGWYKSFKIHTKGHPLAELSRQVGAVHVERKPKKEIAAEQRTDEKTTVRSKEELEEYSEHDHRRIGKDLELFIFHEYAPGQPFWLNNGIILLDQLKDFMRDEILKRGYQRVQTPVINSKELYDISGHWEKYRENLFLINLEDGRTFCLKPMNCPDHALVFKSKSRSYRDLPLKFAEWTTLYRNELSGVLSGLFRVLGLTQDDAHIYCRDNQIETELREILEFMTQVYGVFGFEFIAGLSTKPEQYIGSDDLWERAEKTLENVLKDMKIKYQINRGDGAFYGPKIDVRIKDSLGREWQCATIQLDFNQANRFDLSYVAEDNTRQRPVLIHRAIYGSFERFVGILIEHYQGKFPLWLAPVQMRVMSLTDKSIKYAEKVSKKLKESGFRVENDFENQTLDYKVRQAQTQKIPYMIVIGEKEEEKDTIAVRSRDGKVKFGVTLEDFIKKKRNEVNEKK